MKSRTVLIIGILIASSIFSFGAVEKAYASCVIPVDYDKVEKESELVFTGTVTRLDNYDGPQKVTFFIHEVIKGEINTPKYILENSGKIFLEDGATRVSSVSVDYEIGKTYKVYVEDGKTNLCTTKITPPPTDYMWEPGPEDGNYYSANPVWVNPCDEGYGLADDVCITLEEMNKDLPICDQNPKHDFGKCTRVYEEPENTLDHVLAYCNATGPVTDEERTWWNATHYIDNIDCEFLDKFEYPPPHLEPEPPNSSDEQERMMREYCETGIRHPNMIGIPQCIKNELVCGTGTELVDGICHLIKSDGPTHTKPSIFLDGFIFLILFSPFFIPGAVIFIVLSKTPRYSREIRIAVCIAAILVLLYFLWSLSVGLYPPGYA